MEVFSLEDEDCSGLFITQESKGNNDNEGEKSHNEVDSFLGVDGMDFQSPCVSVVCDNNSFQTHYEDISDEDIVFEDQKKSKVTDEPTSSKTKGAESDVIARGISRLSGWKSRSQIGRKLGFAASKTVSNARRFRIVSDDKLAELRKQQTKKRTFAKVQWAVKAFREWRQECMSSPDTFDARIYESDIDRVELLERDSFEFAMCKFLAEVTKVKDRGEYPGKTLYHMCVSIQKHINLKGRNWKLVESNMFPNIRTTLDNLMKDRASRNIGTVVRQAEVLSFDFESKLWEQGVLGEDSPDKLRSTVLFLIGIYVGLRAGDEHYDLRRDSPETSSQLSFRRNEQGQRCLVYQEDSVTKTNDGGLSSMHKDRKIVWVYPSENIDRCPVRLVDKYISLLPPYSAKSKNSNFYLRSLGKITPAQWYGEQVVGLNTLHKYVKELLKTAKLDGYFTNHSLRRTSTTRLFREGILEKFSPNLKLQQFE